MEYLPKWHREIEIFCKIKPLLLLEGNVLDSYQYPEEGSTPKGSILRLPEYLHYFFKDTGYQNIVFYDSMQGFYNNCEKGYLDNFAALSGMSPENGYIRADFRSSRDNSAAAVTRNVLSQNKESSVIIMNFASRYIINPDNMTQPEVDSFTSLIQASLEAKNVRTPEHGTLKNLLILITNKANYIPAWFYLQNPNVKMITISAPSKEEREALIKGRNFPTFFASDVYREDTVYFSESIIIFTSNLGIYTLDEFGNRHSNVNSDMPYDEVKTRVRTAVEDYFKLQLGRPEILNRIGENIVVFDFIHPDVAKLILDSQVQKIIKNLAVEKHIALSLSDNAAATLTEEANNNLANGGRGIGNVVENLLINPLSRYLFDNEIFENAAVTIDEIDIAANPPALICSRS